VSKILTWVDLDEDEDEELESETSDEDELDASAMTQEARDALELRSRLSYAAVKKLPTRRKEIEPADATPRN